MPNGEDKKLNFTFKVWDETAGAYRPVYIAPDATDTVQGDVKLSDAIDSELDAANGMTAASPKAVKMVQDSANNKLDKVAGADQTVVSKVTFNNTIVVNQGITVPAGYFVIGNLQGNATTATTLQNFRQFSVQIGSATPGTANFNGGADATINVPQVDASVVTTGTLPLSVLPQGALERLVKVADEEARFALTADDVQLGDSVLQIDTETMYIVVDIDHLADASGYQEYAAGTAVLAETAERVQNALTVQKNGATQFTYDGSTAQTINIASSFADLTGQITAEQIPDGIITDEKLGVNYAASDAKGGVATSAAKLENVRNFTFTGPVTGSGTFDGTADVDIATVIGESQIVETMIADSAVTTNKLAASAVTAEKIANDTITNDKMAPDSVDSENIVDGSVTGTDIAIDTVTLNNLAADVGTVAVQTEEPTDTNVKIWVQI